MTYKIYFTKDCYIEVVCDCLQVFSFDDFGSNHDVLRCLNNSEIFLETDFSHVIRVVEICFDAIEVYDKDVTAELRLQCKSSRGGVTGDIVRPPFGNIVFDFEDYLLRFLTIGAHVAIAISIMLVLKHFLKLF